MSANLLLHYFYNNNIRHKIYTPRRGENVEEGEEKETWCGALSEDETDLGFQLERSGKAVPRHGVRPV